MCCIVQIRLPVSKFKLPKSLQIGPHKFKVKKVLAKESEEYIGRCHCDYCEIQIVSEKHGCQSAVDDTVLHEALHGLWRTYCWDEVVKANEVEEAMVTAMAPVLLQFIQDNPKWVKRLLKERE